MAVIGLTLIGTLSCFPCFQKDVDDHHINLGYPHSNVYNLFVSIPRSSVYRQPV